jgi:hypothetical protein
MKDVDGENLKADPSGKGTPGMTARELMREQDHTK